MSRVGISNGRYGICIIWAVDHVREVKMAGYWPSFLNLHVYGPESKSIN